MFGREICRGRSISNGHLTKFQDHMSSDASDKVHSEGSVLFCNLKLEKRFCQEDVSIRANVRTAGLASRNKQDVDSNCIQVANFLRLRYVDFIECVSGSSAQERNLEPARHALFSLRIGRCRVTATAVPSTGAAGPCVVCRRGGQPRGLRSCRGASRRCFNIVSRARIAVYFMGMKCGRERRPSDIILEGCQCGFRYEKSSVH